MPEPSQTTSEYAVITDPYACRLIALNGYAAWSNTLVGNPAPRVKAEFERSNKPEPGDLVLETSSMFRWLRHDTLGPGVALGWLLKIQQDPIMTREEFDELHAEGSYHNEPDETYESLPTETVYYLRPLDNSEVEEQRWVNASFIRIHSEFPRG